MMLRKHVLITGSLLSRLVRGFLVSRFVLLYLAPASFDVNVESKHVKLLLDLDNHPSFFTGILCPMGTNALDVQPQSPTLRRHNLEYRLAILVPLHPEASACQKIKSPSPTEARIDTTITPARGSLAL